MNAAFDLAFDDLRWLHIDTSSFFLHLYLAQNAGRICPEKTCTFCKIQKTA